MSEKPIHWQYYFARKFSLQRFEIVARTFGKGKCVEVDAEGDC